MQDFDQDVASCAKHLNEGRIILYPTDTVWGLGCDARNDEAVNGIIRLKNRPANKSFVILVENIDLINSYALPPSDEMLQYKNNSDRPVTFILEGAKNLCPEVISENGTVAIRVPDDAFCISLLKAFGGPLVSTSANTSSMGTPPNFGFIEPEIKNGVDYVVQHRQAEMKKAFSSKIIRQQKDGTIEVLRD